MISLRMNRTRCKNPSSFSYISFVLTLNCYPWLEKDACLCSNNLDFFSLMGVTRKNLSTPSSKFSTGGEGLLRGSRSTFMLWHGKEKLQRWLYPCLHQQKAKPSWMVNSSCFRTEIYDIKTNPNGSTIANRNIIKPAKRILCQSSRTQRVVPRNNSLVSHEHSAW